VVAFALLGLVAATADMARAAQPEPSDYVVASFPVEVHAGGEGVPNSVSGELCFILGGGCLRFSPIFPSTSGTTIWADSTNSPNFADFVGQLTEVG
jgi:hypothetical protein